MASIDPSKLQKFHKGELKFIQLFNVDAKQIAAIFWVGHNFFKGGQLERAKNIFEVLAVLDDKLAYVQSMLGAIHHLQENYNVALVYYTRALEFFPEDINSLTNRGEVYVKLGHFEEAASDLKKAIDLDPEMNHPSANRARLLALLATDSLKSIKEKGEGALPDLKKRVEERLRSPR
jgi:tetratricopeptide (TPR) repeat protein